MCSAPKLYVCVCALFTARRPVCAERAAATQSHSPRPATGPYTTDFTADKAALIGKPPVRAARILSGRLLAAALFLPSEGLLSLSFASAGAFPYVAHLCSDRNSGLPCVRIVR